MALGGIYKTGTISTDGTAVTGTGTLWSVAQIEQGDFLIAAGLVGIVSSVTDDTHIVLESAWAGTDLSDANYELLKMSWVRYDPSYVQAKVRDLLAELQGTGVIYAVTTDTPDVGIGEDGQYALKTNAGTWKIWLKVDGEWALQGTPVGITSQGVWSNSTTYAVNDWVTRNGSAYISQTANNLNHDPATDTTNWTLFGAQGDTGPAPTLSGTSTSTVTVGIGSKTLTTQSGIAWSNGQRLRITNSDASLTLVGVVSSYSGTTLQIDVDQTLGTGTAASWNIVITGERGIQGPIGTTGPTGNTGPAPILSGTSTSILTVGYGAKTFITQTNVAWSTGQRLRATSADLSLSMVGIVSSYAGGVLTIVVDETSGAGSSNSWNIVIAGERGLQGIEGSVGPQGIGINPDATGTLAQRSAYDAETQGFKYLQTDVAPFRLWVKGSNTTADWDGPTYIGGAAAVGDLGSVSDDILETFDYGVAA